MSLLAKKGLDPASIKVNSKSPPFASSRKGLSTKCEMQNWPCVDSLGLTLFTDALSDVNSLHFKNYWMDFYALYYLAIESNDHYGLSSIRKNTQSHIYY